jgi:hypothetical protein
MPLIGSVAINHDAASLIPPCSPARPGTTHGIAVSPHDPEKSRSTHPPNHHPSMKTKQRPVIISIMLVSRLLSAADFHWDGPSVLVDGVSAGGSGGWADCLRRHRRLVRDDQQQPRPVVRGLLEHLPEWRGTHRHMEPHSRTKCDHHRPGDAGLQRVSLTPPLQKLHRTMKPPFPLPAPRLVPNPSYSTKGQKKKHAAAAGEVFHGWRGDRQQGVCQRGVRSVAGALHAEAVGRRAAHAWQRQARRRGAVEHARPTGAGVTRGGAGHQSGYPRSPACWDHTMHPFRVGPRRRMSFDEWMLLLRSLIMD